MLKTVIQRALFRGSAVYWEKRYRSDGNSGAGSYGRLARFKAEIVNNFVEAQRIKSVIEFGSGDGAQLELANYPSYIGVDVAPTIVEKTRRKFDDRPNYSFYHLPELPGGTRAELALSLDVIFHLVEDRKFEAYMNRLFDSATRAVIIYSSNRDARVETHVRHHRFTDWIEKNRSDAVFMHHIPNRYPFDPADPDGTSFADFYIYAVGQAVH